MVLNENKVYELLLDFYAFTSPDCQAEALFPTSPSVCSSITKLVNTIFSKWINQFLYKLTQMVY